MGNDLENLRRLGLKIKLIHLTVSAHILNQGDTSCPTLFFSYLYVGSQVVEKAQYS